MALFDDLVFETCNNPGSGTVSLIGAAASFRSFSQTSGSGDTKTYMLHDGSQWEILAGVFTSGTPNTLTRGTVYSNSANTTAHLNFAGQTNVFGQLPAALAVAKNASGNVVIGGALSGVTGLTTSGVVDFGSIGTGAPTFTTRSAGAKVVLFSQLDGSHADYALGVRNGALWQVVPTSSSEFDWYAGTTLVGSLSGAGALNVASDVVTGGGVFLNNNRGLFTKDTGGTYRTAIVLGTDNNLDIAAAGAQQIRFTNQTFGTTIFSIDSTNSQSAFGGLVQFSGALSGPFAGGYQYTSSGPATLSAGGYTASIVCADNAVAKAFLAYSDVRVKADIRRITPEAGVEFVERSNPVTYLKDGIPEAGLIAQDQIRAGFGQYVHGSPKTGLPAVVNDDGLSIDENVVLNLDRANPVAYLLACCKSLLKRDAEFSELIKAQEARIASLEERIRTTLRSQ